MDPRIPTQKLNPKIRIKKDGIRCDPERKIYKIYLYFLNLNDFFWLGFKNGKIFFYRQKKINIFSSLHF